MKKHVKERRAKNLELGKREAAARCAHCKQPLTTMEIRGGFRFCSFECRDAALEYVDEIMNRLK